MRQELSLNLELLEQTADCFHFRLAIHNASSVKVLLPSPEIQGLRFASKATLRESEWYTSLLVHARWAGFVLQPGETQEIEFRVRPCDIKRPTDDDKSDYYRWCVQLPPGDYLVWYQFEVGEDYFDPDSHSRFPDLQREAEMEQAVVWTGQRRSNRLHVVRA